ncbi:MAG: T9SS type A sorting domain-containing protein [Flavobacteriales bacterium]|nr:T9SS type A sorting domain-containing protein [Flavobacteriales bacterium]
MAVDANLLSINSPVNGQITCDNNLSPEISFKNKGMDTLFEVTINYEIDGGSVESITWQDTLITNGSELITFPSITVSTGVHQFIAWTSNPNQSTDLNMTNDTSTSSFEVINPSGTALPLTEGFESSTFPNTDWDLINPDNSYTWETASTVSGFESSTTSIILNNFESDFSGQRDGLQTPYLDFTTAVGGTIALEFNVAYARYSNFYHDSLLVKVSTDCGQTWQTLYAKGNNDLSTNGNVDQSNLFVPISSEWRTETITLDSYAGTPKIQFQFENYSGYGNAVYLDDINIYYTPPSAFPDANFSTSNATNCAGNPVQFNDETLFGPTQWAWSFNSGTPATSTAQNPEITFNMFGTFNVELIATNSFGSDTASSTITIINSPIISATSTNESTPGASDGTATANASGGNTPYTYLWDNGETTSNISGLSIGKYTVTVFDASGCYNQADASISLVSIIELNSNSFFKLYPNPSTGNLTLEWIDTPSSAVEITVYNVIGETIISKQNERNKTIINLDLSNYSKGIYVISVKTDTQQFTKKLILK